MGYYARGYGSVRFRCSSEELLDHLCRRVGEVFEDYDAPQHNRDTEFDDIEISFWTDDKYHGDDIEELLAWMVENFEIEDGCVEFAGEDDCYWRFLYVKERGGFIEQNGRIVYDD